MSTNHRLYNDMATIHKNKDYITNCSPESLCLFTVTFNTRGFGVRFKQTRAIFPFRRVCSNRTPIVRLLFARHSGPSNEINYH